MLRRILKILLALVLVAIVYLAFESWHQVSGFHQAMDNAFKAYQAPRDGMAADLNQEQLIVANMLEEADHAFERGNYERAIELYRIIQQKPQSNKAIKDMSLLHECVALYHRNGPQDASFKELLENLSEQAGFSHQDEVRNIRSHLNQRLVHFFL